MSPLLNQLIDLIYVFASISIIAIGGANAVIPEIKYQAIDVYHWMNAETFAHLYAITQAAPGPNVLISGIVGWHVAGFIGMLVATIAMVTPSAIIVFIVGRFIKRINGTRGYSIAQDALVPMAIGLITASGIELSQSANTNYLGYIITASTAIFTVISDKNPIWPLLVAALVSIIAYQWGILV